MSTNSDRETTRLLLRTLTAGDLDALHRHWTDAEVRKYLWDDATISRDRVREQIELSRANFEAHGFGYWAVFRKGARGLAGFCGFREEPDTGVMELIYSIEPRYWGLGYASEAGTEALRYAFEECACDRVVAGADEPNRASFRVMEKIGMRFHERVVRNGLDVVYYSVTRDAWELDSHSGRGGNERTGA